MRAQHRAGSSRVRAATAMVLAPLFVAACGGPEGDSSSDRDGPTNLGGAAPGGASTSGGSVTGGGGTAMGGTTGGAGTSGGTATGGTPGTGAGGSTPGRTHQRWSTFDHLRSRVERGSPA